MQLEYIIDPNEFTRSFAGPVPPSAADQARQATQPPAGTGPTSEPFPGVQPAAPEPADTPVPDFDINRDAPTETTGATPAPADQVLKTRRLLEMRDLVQSRLAATFAGNPAMYKDFKMSNEELEWLTDVYKNYPVLVNKVPAWLDVVLVETVVLGGMVGKVMDKRKQLQQEAERSEIIHQQQTTAGAPQERAKTPEEERKYFDIDEQGLYKYQPHKKDYIKEALRTVQANPVTHYKQLIEANGETMVHKVFNITNAPAGV